MWILGLKGLTSKTLLIMTLLYATKDPGYEVVLYDVERSDQTNSTRT